MNVSSTTEQVDYSSYKILDFCLYLIMLYEHTLLYDIYKMYIDVLILCNKNKTLSVDLLFVFLCHIWGL